MRNSFFTTALVAAFAACNFNQVSASTALVYDDLYDQYGDEELAQISEAEMQAEREAWFAQLSQLAEAEGYELVQMEADPKDTTTSSTETSDSEGTDPNTDSDESEDETAGAACTAA